MQPQDEASFYTVYLILIQYCSDIEDYRHYLLVKALEHTPRVFQMELQVMGSLK